MPKPKRTANNFARLDPSTQFDILRGLFLALHAQRAPAPAPEPAPPDQAAIDATCRELLADILPSL
jgi:hypothetical protein